MNEKLSDYLQNHDFANLMRFEETSSDGEGFDVPKEDMRRLAALGAVAYGGFGKYSITAFGHHVIEHGFSQSPKLPLLLDVDRDEIARKKIATTTQPQGKS